VASFCCSGVQGRGSAHSLSSILGAAPTLGGAGTDKVALDIGQPAQHREHQAPGAGAGVSPRLRQGSELRLRVHDALDDAEQIEGAARQPVNPRYRHDVAGGQLAKHPVQLAPVGTRAGRLLAADVAAAASGGAKLLKLAVEGLPHGTDASIADKAFFGVRFDHNL
jgi:hypothetical protein